MINEHRVRGALYGQALGDALGLAGEFKSSTLLELTYGPGGPTQFEDIHRPGGNGYTWKAGEWSDDTEQALAILDAYLEDGDILPSTVGDRIRHWADTDGRGMGNHTWNVLTHHLFMDAPIAASKEVWEQSGQRSAPNGAVMRTSAVGLLRPEDLDWTEQAAVRAAQVTHYDPRCVASSVAISVAVAVLVTGGSVEAALDAATARAQGYHPEINDFADMTLKQLKLDEGMDDPNLKGRPPIGYTYKCAGAGLWALSEWLRMDAEQYDDLACDRYIKLVQQVIMAGGDTDTNGAVVGAVLGAHIGTDSMGWGLVADLIQELRPREALEARLALLSTLR